jgi:hypothetical protein
MAGAMKEMDSSSRPLSSSSVPAWVQCGVCVSVGRVLSEGLVLTKWLLGKRPGCPGQKTPRTHTVGRAAPDEHARAPAPAGPVPDVLAAAYTAATLSGSTTLAAAS